MKRTDFYNKVTVDDIEELDFLWNSISDFVTSYPVKYYRVREEDLMRPDLISYKMYGNVQFWWFITIINGIENTFLDLVPGMLLKIPSVLDIYDFQKKYRARRS